MTSPVLSAAPPRVAIVGRPNVGKSTLFNRLLGKRQSIVHDQPGVTRDRLFGDLRLADDRVIELIDTGGLVPGDDPLGLSEQVLLAVEESDLLMLVVDGKDGLVSADEAVWDSLRRTGKPTFLLVNKGDTREAKERFSEFYRLGIDPQLLLSAEHGGGIEEVRDALADHFPEAPEMEEPDAPPVAIVGRPNVGKSSLVNRLLGQTRVLVSPMAGTTRDPVDSLIEREGSKYLLIDTAGIRRRSRTSGVAEDLAVMMARRQIQRAHVGLLVIDAADGVTSGDLAIAGSIWELGRAAVVAVNKWDLLTPESRDRLDESWERLAGILADPPRVNISAETGRGVEKIFPALDRSLEAFQTRLSTSAVNEIFDQAQRRHKAPSDRRGQPFKIYYSTQVSTAPPTFIVFANRMLPRADTYRRYLENRLREALDLPGVPVRLVIRKRS